MLRAHWFANTNLEPTLTQATIPLQTVETLREQLIREGSIIPREYENLKEKIRNSLEYLRESISYDTLEHYQKIISRRILEILEETENLIKLKSKSMLINAKALLALRKLANLLNFIVCKEKSHFYKFSPLRNGFFFSFKENKKNTP